MKTKKHENLHTKKQNKKIYSNVRLLFLNLLSCVADVDFDVEAKGHSSDCCLLRLDDICPRFIFCVRFDVFPRANFLIPISQG